MFMTLNQELACFVFLLYCFILFPRLVVLRLCKICFSHIKGQSCFLELQGSWEITFVLLPGGCFSQERVALNTQIWLN